MKKFTGRVQAITHHETGRSDARIRVEFSKKKKKDADGNEQDELTVNGSFTVHSDDGLDWTAGQEVPITIG